MVYVHVFKPIKDMNKIDLNCQLELFFKLKTNKQEESFSESEEEKLWNDGLLGRDFPEKIS